MPQEIQKEEIGLLNQAFEAFNEATSKLEESYQRLERRVESLNLELEEKNRELERNLTEKEKVKTYLNNILKGLPTGVVVIDANRKISTFNSTAGDIAGIPSREACEKDFNEVFDFGEGPGRPLDALLSPASEKKFMEIRFLNRKKRGLDLSISASTMKSPRDGKLERILIIQDMTEMKRLEEKLERNDRLTAMGEMAAGIAHELRNPLGSIELFTSLLRREMAERPDMLEITKHITSGVKKMDHIISGLLTFTRSPKPKLRRYNLHEILDEVLMFNEILIKDNNVTLARNFQCGNPIGDGDADLLNQVFTNLVLNAVQSMPKGGPMTLSTRGGDDGRSLVFILKDTGVGIPSPVKSRIFNPFFTTKETGTGLGLPIVYSIVQAHGGSLEFESTVGEGTTFVVTLPASRSDAPPQ